MLTLSEFITAIGEGRAYINSKHGLTQIDLLNAITSYGHVAVDDSNIIQVKPSYKELEEENIRLNKETRKESEENQWIKT